MSLVRLFLTTAYLIASQGDWKLLREYFDLVTDILTKPEGIVIPGAPKDKQI